WKIMNAYLTANRHRNVETCDFRRAVEQVTGRSFERFFYDWTERPGHPVLDVAYTWNETEKTAEIMVKQTQKEDAFTFPLVLEFRGADGAEPARLTREITDKQATIVTRLSSSPTMFIVDPDQSLLKEITENKPREMWVEQIVKDPNPAGRI